MHARFTPQVLIRLGGVTFTLLAMTACTVIPLQSDQPVKDTAVQQGYPGPVSSATPGPIIFPTQADGSPSNYYSYFATPSPEEKVSIAGIEEAPKAEPTPYYRFESTMVGSGSGRTMVLTAIDPRTGDTVHLGDDSGSALIGTMNDAYVVWHFLCDPCKSMEPGLYVHSFADGKDTLVDYKTITTQGSTRLSGNWLTYMKPSEAPSRYGAQLWAYNIEKAAKVLIADDAVYLMAEASKFNTVNEGMVAWVGDGPTVNDRTLNVYDLTTNAARQIKTELRDPQHVSISQDVVVWWDVFWKGYDLSSSEQFTIPILPIGWDASTVKSVGPVTVRGKQLSWTVEANSTTYYFTASIVKK